MILMRLTQPNGKLNEILVTGHAGYAKHGQDIVCAAVSAATLVTANAILHLKLNDAIHLDVKEGYFKATLKKHDDIVIKLLENLEYTLLDLEKQYPKYIKNQKEG